MDRRITIGQDLPFEHYVPQVIENYGKAIANGHDHVYEALPRLLTVWYEFGSHYESLPAVSKQNAQASHRPFLNALQAVPGA